LLKTYSKSSKKLNLSDSQRISRILIDKVQIHFPIEHEVVVERIFEYLDDRLKIYFDIDLLETELLKATKKEHLQFLFRNYFRSLRKYFGPQSVQKPVIIDTFKRKNVLEMPIVKPLKETAYEIRQRELQEMKERAEEEGKMTKTLKSLKGVWKPSVHFSEYDEDVLHTK
jgi:hypothetical protein